MKSQTSLCTILLVLLPSLASAQNVRCFGFEGKEGDIKNSIELKATPHPEMKAAEFKGSGNFYLFHAMVFDDNSVILSAAAKDLPVGVGASSPKYVLEKLLDKPSKLGLLQSTSVLSVYNPASETNTAFVGCGLE